MEEILRSICPLAQDQYGNYVVQVNVLVLRVGGIVFVDRSVNMRLSSSKSRADFVAERVALMC